MAMPPEHAALLARTDFVAHSAGGLDDKERMLLARYGRWLEALAKGDIAPITPEQQRFVQAARGECPPCSAFESAWIKHCRAREDGGMAARIDPIEASERLARLAEARAAADALHAEYDAERQAVLEQVRGQLDALQKAYADLLQSADAEVAKREDEARQAVLMLGESAQHGQVRAVYCRGRVTWDSRSLEQYAEQHPEVAAFRRMGKPSVQLRYRGAKA